MRCSKTGYFDQTMKIICITETILLNSRCFVRAPNLLKLLGIAKVLFQGYPKGTSEKSDGETKSENQRCILVAGLDNNHNLVQIFQ